MCASLVVEPVAEPLSLVVAAGLFASPAKGVVVVAVF